MRIRLVIVTLSLFVVGLLIPNLLGSRTFANEEPGRQEVDMSASSDDWFLDNRVNELERKVRLLERRMRAVEDQLDRDDGRPPGRPPEVEVQHFCLLTDTSQFKELHLGSGQTRLDAEFAAEQRCKRETVVERHCQITETNLRCDSTLVDVWAKSFVCILTDSSAFKDRHRGEGRTALVAEHEARTNCARQASGGHRHCQTQVRCEAIY